MITLMKIDLKSDKKAYHRVIDKAESIAEVI
jgi:hypothetical protein